MMEDRVRAFVKVVGPKANTSGEQSSLKIGASNTSIAVPLDKENAKVPITFTFEKCFAEDASVEAVAANLRPIIESSLAGLNVSVVLFGSTENEIGALFHGGSQSRGLVELITDMLFKHPANPGFPISLRAYEISSDRFSDILSTDSSHPVRIGEDARGTVGVEGLNTVKIENSEQASDIFAELCMLKKSPDAIVQAIELDLISMVIDPKSKTSKKVTSLITVFDVSGQGISRANNSQIQDIMEIQPPMAALRSVIETLSVTSSKSAVSVPYRNHLVTWGLRNALGGNSRCAFIGIISNDADDYDETRSTLAITRKAGGIKNRISVNELPCSVLNRAVNREMQMLWQKIAAESSVQQSASPAHKERARRLSVEALSHLNRMTHEEEINMYKERALAAEKASKERADVLWESFQQLRAHLVESIQHIRAKAREEALQELQGAHVEQNDVLYTHASALLIQVWWRRYQLRRAQKDVTAAIEMNEELCSELDQVREQLKQTQERCDKAEEEISVLKLRVEEKSQTVGQHITQLEAFLREREREILSLQNQVLNNVKSSDTRVAELQQNLLDSEKQIADLTRKLAESNHLNAQLECSLRNACAEKEQISSNQVSLRTSITELEQKLASKDSEIQALNARIESETNTAKNQVALQARITGLESELDAKDREIATLNTRLAAETKANVSKINEVHNLQVRTLRLEAEESDRQRIEAEQALQTTRTRLRQAEQDMDTLRKRLLEAESTAQKYQSIAAQANDTDHKKQVSALEARIAELSEAETQMQKAHAEELKTLREQLQQANDAALEELSRANAQLQEKSEEETKEAQRDCLLLRSKIGNLELQLQTTRAVTAKEIEEREKRVRELEHLHKEIQTREREDLERKTRELENMEIQMRCLKKELEKTKTNTSQQVAARDSKLKELEKTLQEQKTASHNPRLTQASFMQYKRDPRQRPESTRRLSTASVIQPANSTIVAATQQQEDLLCVRVDVESFDDRSALFYANSSSVLPEDPTTRTFHVRSPLYDLRKARWSRFKIRVIHQSAQRIDEVTHVCLEHHLPGGRSIIHKLKVTKADHAREGGLAAVTCDWDTGASTGHSHAVLDDGLRSDQGQNCFCFHKMEESGPMTLHATLRIGDLPVHWEYPLRFRNKSDFIEKLPGIGQKFLSSRRAQDAVKHEYLNASWFCVESDSQGPARAEPIVDGTRIVSFSGYLMKQQSHRGGKVQRWFVFAPPFLLCYQDFHHAAEDFSDGRALPHSANRAMRIGAATKIVTQPGPDRIEFSVQGEDKLWVLQAANKEDAERWTNVLNAWVTKELEQLPPGTVPTRHPVAALTYADDDDDDDM